LGSTPKTGPVELPLRVKIFILKIDEIMKNYIIDAISEEPCNSTYSPLLGES
jgi:hypothetical protein